MADQHNKSFKEMTKAELSELGRIGGLKSVEVRRKRKSLKEQLLMVLSDEGIQIELIEALINKARSGDTKAFEVLRDTAGEKPSDKIEAEIINKTIRVELTDE